MKIQGEVVFISSSPTTPPPLHSSRASGECDRGELAISRGVLDATRAGFFNFTKTLTFTGTINTPQNPIKEVRQHDVTWKRYGSWQKIRFRVAEHTLEPVFCLRLETLQIIPIFKSQDEHRVEGEN
jgi:hypothetical protein